MLAVVVAIVVMVRQKLILVIVQLLVALLAEPIQILNPGRNMSAGCVGTVYVGNSGPVG